MPRDTNGNYTLPSGNPVVSNTLITSVWANDTMSDLANEMQDSLSRSGKGGFTAPVGIVDKSGAIPGLNFSSEPTSGFKREAAGDLRIQVLGQDNIRFLSTNQATDVWNNDLTVPAWERVFTTPVANVLDANVEKLLQVKRETVAATVPSSTAAGEIGVNIGDDPPTLYVGDGTTAKPIIPTPDEVVRFPSGTIMVFEAPAAAPTGWVKKIDAAYDDVAMRVVTGTLTQGGTHAFSTLFTDLAEGASPGVGNKTLGEQHIPQHNHGGGVHGHGLNQNSGNGSTGFISASSFAQATSGSANYMAGGENLADNSNLVNVSVPIIQNYGGTTPAHAHTFDNKLKYRSVYFGEKS